MRSTITSLIAADLSSSQNSPPPTIILNNARTKTTYLAMRFPLDLSIILSDTYTIQIRLERNVYNICDKQSSKATTTRTKKPTRSKSINLSSNALNATLLLLTYVHFPSSNINIPQIDRKLSTIMFVFVDKVKSTIKICNIYWRGGGGERMSWAGAEKQNGIPIRTPQLPWRNN